MLINLSEFSIFADSAPRHNKTTCRNLNCNAANQQKNKNKNKKGVNLQQELILSCLCDALQLFCSL